MQKLKKDKDAFNRSGGPKEATNEYIEQTRESLINTLTPAYEVLVRAHEDYAKAIPDIESNDKAKAIEGSISKIQDNYSQLTEKIRNTREIRNALSAHYGEIELELDRILDAASARAVTGAAATGEQPASNPTSDPANDRKSQNETSMNDDSWSLSDYLILFLAVILAAGLLGAGVWWVQMEISRLHQRMEANQKSTAAEFGDARNHLNRIATLVGENKRVLESLQSRTLPALGTQIMDTLARFEFTEARGKGRESIPHSYASFAPAISFPPQQATVAEYLTRVSPDSIKAKKVLMLADALQEALDGDAIYILSPDERQQDLFKAIPNYPRFSSSQDYSHYAPFYDCDQPSSGEVWIIEPALARFERDLNQWRLYKKGRLQIS
jgi:hypothetical protein